jgi:hypothetical protein
MTGLQGARFLQGPGHGGVVLIVRPFNITHGDGCSETIAWYIGASACSIWWLSIMCVLLGLIETSTGVVFAISSRVSGRVHKSVVGSLYPRKIMLSLWMTSHFLPSKVTLHLALHRILMSIREAIVIPRTICPINIVGRPGMMMSQMWVETILLMSGKVMVIGWSAQHRFLTSVPFMMNIEVTPVSTMACVVAIEIALAHSKRCNGAEQFDAMTVALSSLIDNSAANGSKRLYSVGYDDVC